MLPRVIDSTSMKTGASSLNPYAASYIPLSERGATDNIKDFGKSKAINNGNENVWCGHQLSYISVNDQQQNVSQGRAHSGEFTTWKGHHAGDFYPSLSNLPNGAPETLNYNQGVMDWAYLQMKFPSVSEGSLSDVYFANGCDLEASIDMLDQLEIYPDDPSHKLPDTLDIGDVPDSLPSASRHHKDHGTNSQSHVAASSILSSNS